MVKKHSVSEAARTASLTDLRRWPGDGFFGQNSEIGIPTSVGEQSRNSDFGGRAKSEFRPWAARARQAGSDAGQVAQPGGFYARQVAQPGGLDAGPEGHL